MAIFALCTTHVYADDYLAYHVVGKVNSVSSGKSRPIVMNTHITSETHVSIPYGGKLELMDETGNRRIILKTPGSGAVKTLMKDGNNTISKLSASYAAYVKKQMTNTGLVSKQRYTDFATVTRELDSVPDGQANAGKQGFGQTLQGRFNKFKNQKQKRFESFRDQCNRKYTDFVRKAWVKFDSNAAIDRPQDQHVDPRVSDDAVRNNQTQEERKEIKASASVRADNTATVTQPTPIEQVKETSLPDAVSSYSSCMPFTYFGTDLSVRLDETKRVNLGKITPDRIADALLYFSTETYDNLLYDCLKIRQEYALCDWAYLMMLQQLADQFCGEGTDESTLLLGHLFCQSGYKIRYASDESGLHLLVASPHIIYGRAYYVIDGDMYYPMKNIAGAVDICLAQFPNEKTLSLDIDRQPLLAWESDDTRTIRSKRYPEIELTFNTNRNLLAFYDCYPPSCTDNDPTTRWLMYASTPVDEHVKAKIYPTLREKLQGLDDLEAVNRILNLIQTGLEYEYDDNVWGGDRAFFAEETLHYPFCDCEDRAILFTRLVRDLLDLDCALVYYPGHLGAAVRFKQTVAGTNYVTDAGSVYTVCDPTYINAYVGEQHPDYDNVEISLIELPTARHEQ